MNFKKLLSILALLLTSSCFETRTANDQDNDSQIGQIENIKADGSNIQGDYSANIWPINYNLQFRTIGTVGIRRINDLFKVSTIMQYGPKGSMVRQAFYNAKRCPNIHDDLNKDAYIDIEETRKVIGKMIIPFDGDIDSQLGGNSIYPFVDLSGKMEYSGIASFSRMFEDLKAPDPDIKDQISKIGINEGITFAGRIVLFQGVHKKVKLPQTVATEEGLNINEVTPIGCAVLWKVNEMPAELNMNQE